MFVCRTGALYGINMATSQKKQNLKSWLKKLGAKITDAHKAINQIHPHIYITNKHLSIELKWDLNQFEHQS